MSLIKRLMKIAMEKRDTTLSESENPSGAQKLIQWYQNTSATASGINVTAEQARRTATVYACVNAISQDCAKMPLEMMKDKKGGGKEKADNHPLYHILKHEPNPYMSPYEFKQLMFSWAVGRGESFAWIDRDPASVDIRALYPMRPDRVSIKVDTYGSQGQMFPAPVYEYQMSDGSIKRFPFWEVLHFKINVADDGFHGRSPIMDAAESIGLEVAARTFAARLFANGAQPAGILRTKGELTDDQFEEMRRSWQEIYGGMSNANKTAILEEGIAYEKIGMTPNECQFLETRQYQRREIAAGIYRVPGPIIGDYENATFNNMEQLMLLYVQGCLLTWCEAFEEKCWQSLLLPSEQKKYSFKFNMNVLLRADMKTRYESYAIARQWGWECPDSILELEDRDPLPNGIGQEYLAPMNMLPAGTDRAEFFAKRLGGNKPGVDAKTLPQKDEEPTQNDQNPPKNEQNSAIKGAFSGLFTQLFERYSNRERKAIGAAVKRIAATGTKQDLLHWGEKFYGELKEDFERDLIPLISAYAQASGIDINASEWCSRQVHGWKDMAQRLFAGDVLDENIGTYGGGMCFQDVEKLLLELESNQK